MFKNFILFLTGLGLGVFVFLLFSKYGNGFTTEVKLANPLSFRKYEIIGFTPYWLIGKDGGDYSGYITSLSYFSLIIGPDGKIMKYTDEAETETDPGFLGLKKFKSNGLKSSLVLFAADKKNIDLLMSDPEANARNLASDVTPIIDEYGFKEVNLDIEDVEVASDSARSGFTLFAQTFYNELKKHDNKLELSIDVSPIVLFKPYLTDLASINKYFDKIVFMMYDFHYQNSSVTGAVSPVGGAGLTEEFDTDVSVKKALEILPAEKIIIGVPLYGYEWETLSDKPKSGVIPGTGITASNKRVEDLLEKCATCSPQFDPVTKESYVIYKNQDTDTYHQIFYPGKTAMEEKIKLVRKYKLGGIALWALGYEGKEILEPLKGL